MHTEEKPTEETPPPERQAWRVKEFCENHRISQATFFKYQAAGRIKTIRIGRRVLIPAAEALRIQSEGL